MSSKPSPQIDVALTAAASTCHLSGEPPFTLSISFTSRALRPLTFQKTGTVFDFPSALDSDHMDIIQAKTGANLNTRHVDVVRFPVARTTANESKFVTLQPNVTYVASHTFRMKNQFEDVGDKAHAVSMSDGYPLRDGGDYTIRVTMNTTIERWWWGTKEEILDGKEGEKNAPIILQYPHEPRAEVNIHVVE